MGNRTTRLYDDRPMTRDRLGALVEAYWRRLAQLDALDPARVRLVRLYRRALLRAVCSQ
jgi:hypothetical protein